MNVGTKSLLFGVHQFLWHPICVARAWRFLHDRWPTIPEWICIALHDVGYWGCSDMDGETGQRHPERGAYWASKVIGWYCKLRGYPPDRTEFMQWHYAQFTLFHSRFYAKRAGQPVSELFLADKLAVLFEPQWFYILRATLSGEIYEYIAQAGERIAPNCHIGFRKFCWLRWYRWKVLNLFAQYRMRDERLDSLPRL